MLFNDRKANDFKLVAWVHLNHSWQSTYIYWERRNFDGDFIVLDEKIFRYESPILWLITGLPNHACYEWVKREKVKDYDIYRTNINNMIVWRHKWLWLIFILKRKTFNMTISVLEYRDSRPAVRAWFYGFRQSTHNSWLFPKNDDFVAELQNFAVSNC